jgi:hypothetical protein
MAVVFTTGLFQLLPGATYKGQRASEILKEHVSFKGLDEKLVTFLGKSRLVILFSWLSIGGTMK